MRIAALVFISALLLSACADNRFRADVARFHSGNVPQQTTVAIVPADDSLANSLEFTTYANQIGEELGTLGFSPAPRDEASLIAQVSYGSNKMLGPDRGSPVSIGVGVGGGGGNVGVGLGGAFGIGKSKPNESYVNMLAVQLQDRATRQTVWEGRATAEGDAEGGSLSAMMPDLIDALFSDFPGASGQTVEYVEPGN